MERIVKGIWIPIEIWQDSNLTWNEKILLMEIDSFTSKGKECYISNEYIAHLLNVTERMATTYLAHLVDAGYVRVVRFDGRCRYVETNYDFQSGWKQTSSQDSNPLPHTYNKKPIDKKEDTIGKSTFHFKSALLDLGVKEEVVDAWLAVRRNKRATNSEIAFNKIKEEIIKSGRTPNECITICVENSWQGFKAEWLLPRGGTRTKESVFAHNLKVMDQMYGTNMHDQAYGRRQPDEQ